MERIFLDANVFYSASKSLTGGSSTIFKIVKLKRISVYASKEVLLEAESNIRLKESLKVRLRFYELVKKNKIRIVPIHKKTAEKKYLKIINRKDTYVLEGARKSKAKYLLTLDKKHFFTIKIKKAKLPFKTITPGEFLQELAEENQK